METSRGLMLAQVEDSPDKVMDMMLDEYNLAQDPERRQRIKEAMELHAQRPTIFLNKKREAYSVRPEPAFESSKG